MGAWMDDSNRNNSNGNNPELMKLVVKLPYVRAKIRLLYATLSPYERRSVNRELEV